MPLPSCCSSLPKKWCCSKDSKAKPTPSELGLTEHEADTIVSLLLQHAYHLPSHTWTQDLWQYLTNNHPLFGIWFHHPLHPLQSGVRYLSLLGSIFMGLAITCIIYTAFVFSDSDYDKQYVEFSTNATRTGLQEDLDDNVSVLSVTNGNIALWTVGAFLHGLYDNTVWALAAGQCCTCCLKKKDQSKLTRKQREEKFQNTGSFLVLLSVVIVVALTFFAVSMRQALTSDDGTEVQAINATESATSSEEEEHDAFGQVNARDASTFRVKMDGANDWEFIIAYLVELGLSYFVYYPVIGTLLFSGVLTCGKYFSVTGGRPYEITNRDNDLEEGNAKRKSAAGFQMPQMSVKSNSSTKKNATPTATTTSAGSAGQKANAKKTAREARIQKEMEKAKSKKLSELKKELADRNISTTTFVEKTDFVKAYAVAVVDGIHKKPQKKPATNSNNKKGSQIPSNSKR